MKQIVMTGPRTSIVAEIAEVTPNEDQILIRQTYVGVCMSEHYSWETAKAGDAMGHEPLGEVVQVGKNVSGFAVGEVVSGLWGNTMPGSGGMTEFALADPRKDIVVKVPANVRREDAILEPLACLMSAASKVREGMPGTKVCVVGCGYMGCGAISLLKLRGFYVVGVDIHSACLEDARRYGADEAYLVDEVLGHYPNGSFSIVMEWGETNESLDLAINLTAMCGQLCIGAYHTGGKRLVDVQQLNWKAIDCLSVHPREHSLNDSGARNAAALLESGAWRFVNLPVKIYPMDQFDLAQAELETKQGSHMKAIIDMTQSSGEPRML